MIEDESQDRCGCMDKTNMPDSRKRGRKQRRMQKVTDLQAKSPLSKTNRRYKMHFRFGKLGIRRVEQRMSDLMAAEIERKQLSPIF
jgi:hypothetical protein